MYYLSHGARLSSSFADMLVSSFLTLCYTPFSDFQYIFDDYVLNLKTFPEQYQTPLLCFQSPVMDVPFLNVFGDFRLSYQ